MTVGSTWHPEATFTDADGVLYDPDTVDVNSISPSGTVAPASFINPSTGVYLMSVPLTEPGFWFIEITGTGPDDQVVVGTASMCATASLVPA